MGAVSDVEFAVADAEAVELAAAVETLEVDVEELFAFVIDGDVELSDPLTGSKPESGSEPFEDHIGRMMPVAGS